MFSVQPGFEEDTSMETPIVRYCAVSGIEASHKAAITDVQWVPDHMEVRIPDIIFFVVCFNHLTGQFFICS